MAPLAVLTIEKATWCSCNKFEFQMESRLNASHKTPVFAKVWLSPSLFYLSNIFFTKQNNSKNKFWALGHVHLVKWKQISCLNSKRHSTLTYKWSSGFSVGSPPPPPQKRTKILLTMKVRGCYRTMRVSIHAHSEVCESLRSLVRRTCWWLSFASRCTSFLREANGREPGLVMYCVSVKLHREGCYGLA